jgi:hypothetical protein
VAFQPFADELSDCRVVYIPPGLDDDQRSRFVARVAAAVAQQTELAAHRMAVLRPTGEISDEGDRLLLGHEPAAACNPVAILDDQRPDVATLWWITAAMLDALHAAAAAKTVHGGIQLGSLFIDEGGQPKLGDFGLAPAFEAIGDAEARRWTHCQAAVSRGERQRVSSGAWRLLGEEETREHGWIVPYASHELLEGRLRFNLKSDQFALGVMLYLLAAGTHPYGAALSDPTLNLYFHLDPSPLNEERRDWAESFERQQANLATQADRSIVAWAEVVTHLLASDANARQAASATDEGVREYLDAKWTEAAAAIAAGRGSLESGDAEAFLTTLTPWTTDEALPEIWRNRLAIWVAGIDAQKGEFRTRHARRQHLAAAQDAFDGIQLDRARAEAEAVVNDPEAEEDLRHAAEELLALCNEQEQFIASGADAVAVAYLDAAQEALDHEAFEDARQVLEGLLRDPAMPRARVGRARHLLGDVELAAQRLQRQTEELAAATESHRKADYDTAAVRLAELLAEPHLAGGVAERARPLLAEAQAGQQRRAAHLAAIRQGYEAWQGGDLVGVDAALNEVPTDIDDPAVRPERERLAAAADRLRVVHEQQSEAERLLAANDADGARTLAEKAAAEDLPASTLSGLTDLVSRCRALAEEQQQARLSAARAALDEAQRSFDAGDVPVCRRSLEQDVLAAAGLPDEVRQEAERLLRECPRLEQAASLLDQAAADLDRSDFDAADRDVQAVSPTGLPASIGERCETLRQAIAAARRKRLEQQQTELRKRLERAKLAIEATRFREAAATLREVEASPYLNDALRARAAELAQLLAARRPSRNYAVPAVGGAVLLVAALAVTWALWPSSSVMPQPEPQPKPPTQPVVTPAVPTFAEASETLQAALAAELKGLDGPHLRGTPADGLRLEARAGEHPLLPQAALTFDAAQGTFLPDVDTLARWFSLQAAALDVVARPGALRVQDDEAGEVTLTLADPTGVRVEGVDVPGAAVLLTVPVRLPDDPRPASQFDLHGLVVDGFFAADEEGQAAYVVYRDALRAHLAADQAERMHGVLEKLQAEVAAAAEQATRPNWTPPQYTLRFEPADNLPAKLIAEAADGSSLTLGECDAAGLDELTLTPAWKERLFPPPAMPTFTEAAASFREALQAALGADFTLSPWPTEPQTPLDIGARWDELDLLPFSPVEFDAATGTLAPPPATVAQWFRGQATVLAALGQPASLVLDVAAPYDADLTLVDPAAVHLTAYAPASQSIGLTAAARLAADPRPTASFTFSGELADARLTADAAGQGAFAEYLRALQQDRATAVAEEAAQSLNLPAGLSIAGPAESAGGPELTLDVLRAGERLTTLPAVWDAPTLAYRVDAAAGRTRIAEALHALAGSESFQATLRASWPDVAKALAVPPTHPAAAWFARCVPLETNVRPAGESAEFGAETRVVLGPPDAPPDERITITVPIGFVDGKFTWHTDALADTQQALRQALQQLAESPTLRQRRATATIAALATELQIAQPSIQTAAEGDTLTATAGGRKHTWTWNPIALDYGNHQVAAPPNLDDRLAALAAAPTIDPAEFVDVLREVTFRKAEGYGAEPYRPGPELSAPAPEAALLSLSNALQVLTAPTPTADPFPTVFIEFFAGTDQVYGLSWHATSGADDRLTGVTDLAVWPVMSAADLHGAGNPDQFRARYATDPELGERLLGHALGEAGQPLAASGGGAFGVIVAPHDALWAVRWEQVRFTPRTITNLANRGADDAGTFRMLRTVLQPKRTRRSGTNWRRAGLWCIPTLGGAWHGPVDPQQTRLTIGRLNLDKGDVTLRFAPRGADNLVFAYTEVPPLGDWAWGTFVKEVRRQEIGYTFWDRGWREDGSWERTPYLTFSLLRIVGE